MTRKLILSLGIAVAAFASPATADDKVAALVTEKLDTKSWFTPEHKAIIRAKCGVDADAQKGRLGINIDGSRMTCPDGRVVDDPQVRAMGQDISRRANAMVRKVMADVDVKTAIAAAATARASAALARAGMVDDD